METEEIRAHLLEARRACAEAESVRLDGVADMEMLCQLTGAMTRLCDLAEEMLAEREAFAGRLRRRPAARPPEPPAISAIAPPECNEAQAQGVTPSPPPRA